VKQVAEAVEAVLALAGIVFLLWFAASILADATPGPSDPGECDYSHRGCSDH